MSSTSVKTWHGDPNLKTTVVARMRAHRKADSIIQGTYQTYDPTTAAGYRGCAIGCMLEYEDDSIQSGTSLSGGSKFHLAVERGFGIHRDLAWVVDCLFEDQDGFEEAGNFAVAVVEAIPVGADVTSRMVYCHKYDLGERCPDNCGCRVSPQCLSCRLSRVDSGAATEILLAWLEQLVPVQEQAAERVLEPVA